MYRFCFCADCTLTDLQVIEPRHSGFKTDDVAETWQVRLPYKMTYIAERAAHRSLVNDLKPHESAIRRNPSLPTQMTGAQAVGFHLPDSYRRDRDIEGR